MFALAGAKHTAISPFPFEHDRIRHWCNERRIPLDDVTMVNGPSQDILPRLDGDLDLVLVDGDHAFPTPLIFVKLNGDDIIDPAGWIGQPFCSVARPIPGAASLAERLRFHLRIRTRLRNLQEGSSGSWPIGKDR